MKADEIFIREFPDGISFGVRVHPRAGRNKIQGVHDGLLKIAIAAAPVDGEATLQCLRFLAEILGVSASRISLVSGAQSRNKVFRVAGMNTTELRQSFEKF